MEDTGRLSRRAWSGAVAGPADEAVSRQVDFKQNLGSWCVQTRHQENRIVAVGVHKHPGTVVQDEAGPGCGDPPQRGLGETLENLAGGGLPSGDAVQPIQSWRAARVDAQSPGRDQDTQGGPFVRGIGQAHLASFVEDAGGGGVDIAPKRPIWSRSYQHVAKLRIKGCQEPQQFAVCEPAAGRLRPPLPGQFGQAVARQFRGHGHDGGVQGQGLAQPETDAGRFQKLDALSGQGLPLGGVVTAVTVTRPSTVGDTPTGGQEADIDGPVSAQPKSLGRVQRLAQGLQPKYAGTGVGDGVAKNQGSPALVRSFGHVVRPPAIIINVVGVAQKRSHLPPDGIDRHGLAVNQSHTRVALQDRQEIFQKIRFASVVGFGDPDKPTRHLIQAKHPGREGIAGGRGRTKEDETRIVPDQLTGHLKAAVRAPVVEKQNRYIGNGLRLDRTEALNEVRRVIATGNDDGQGDRLSSNRKFRHCVGNPVVIAPSPAQGSCTSPSLPSSYRNKAERDREKGR